VALRAVTEKAPIARGLFHSECSVLHPSSVRFTSIHLEGLDGVADLDVVEVLDAQAALVTVGHFLGIVLESLEIAEVAGVDHDAVSDQAYLCCAAILPSTT
jgi:hypothetical protein